MVVSSFSFYFGKYNFDMVSSPEFLIIRFVCHTQRNDVKVFDAFFFCWTLVPRFRFPSSALLCLYYFIFIAVVWNERIKSHKDDTNRFKNLWSTFWVVCNRRCDLFTLQFSPFLSLFFFCFCSLFFCSVFNFLRLLIDPLLIHLQQSIFEIRFLLSSENWIPF